MSSLRNLLQRLSGNPRGRVPQRHIQRPHGDAPFALPSGLLPVHHAVPHARPELGTRPGRLLCAGNLPRRSRPASILVHRSGPGAEIHWRFRPGGPATVPEAAASWPRWSSLINPVPAEVSRRGQPVRGSRAAPSGAVDGPTVPRVRHPGATRQQAGPMAATPRPQRPGTRKGRRD